MKTCILFLLLCSCILTHAQQIPLAGEWRFAIDRNDVGVTEKWFNKPLNETIKLPGTMAENMKGDDVTLQTKWTGMS
jgi:beta-galactosidase/beta-glucuronidase